MPSFGAIVGKASIAKRPVGANDESTLGNRHLLGRRSLVPLISAHSVNAKKTTPGSARGAAERGVKPTEVADR
jgi:hypothetical protein